MKKRRILITGVCGMIGSHILDVLLDAGEEVVGVDNLSFGKKENIESALHRSNFKFIKMDISDTKRLRRVAGKADIILHLAAVKKISENDPSLATLKGSAEATESVLRVARDCGAKVILGSTSDIYGTSTSLPFREDGDSVIGPSTAKRWAYAVSKLFCEHLAMTYQKDFGVRVVILRYFGCFSERSSTSWSGGHIPIFIDSILSGRPVVIHGDGKQTRSMAHASDIVRGTLLAMDSSRAVGEIINLGNDEEVSVVDCAKIISKMTGMKARIRFVPIKKLFGTYREIARRVPDLSKAKRLLGYKPEISFREALRRVILERQG